MACATVEPYSKFRWYRHGLRVGSWNQAYTSQADSPGRVFTVSQHGLAWGLSWYFHFGHQYTAGLKDTVVLAEKWNEMELSTVAKIFIRVIPPPWSRFKLGE